MSLFGPREVSYADLEPAAKKAAAIQDIISYLGMEKFLLTHDAAIHDELSLKQFCWALQFVGIEGYPARAWYAHVYSDEKLEKELAGG